jgi:hypothetical protein
LDVSAVNITAKFGKALESSKGFYKKYRVYVLLTAVFVTALALGGLGAVIAKSSQQRSVTTVAATPAPKAGTGTSTRVASPTPTPHRTFSSANGQVFTFHGLKLQLPPAPKYYGWKVLSSNHSRMEISSCPPTGCVSISFYNYQLTREEFENMNRDCAIRLPSPNVSIGGKLAYRYEGSKCIIDGSSFVEKMYLVPGDMVITVTRSDLSRGWLGVPGAIEGTGPHQPSVLWTS